MTPAIEGHGAGPAISTSSVAVPTRLTHFYTKLNLTSRVQLVHEAARHDRT
jgi:DNA-binding NarL/FixJ family response regulator